MGWLAKIGGPLLLAAGLLSGGASAQDIERWSVDRYRLPASPDSGLMLQSSDTAERGSVHFQLAIGYQHEPVIFETETGIRVSTPVEHRATAYLSMLAGVTTNFAVYIQLPLTLWQDGDFEELDKFAAEDLALGAHARLYGDDEGFALAANLALVFPTGKVSAFASDDSLGGRATLIFAYDKSTWGLALNLGGDFRPKRVAFDFESGSDMVFVAGVYGRPIEWIRVGGEVFGATGITKNRFFTSSNTHVEGAITVRFTNSHGSFIQLGGAFGIARGVGTPSGRAMLTAGTNVGGK